MAQWGMALGLAAALALPVGCTGNLLPAPSRVAERELAKGDAVALHGATAGRATIAPLRGEVRFDHIEALRGGDRPLSGGSGAQIRTPGFGTQASIGDDVAAGATVSLIDPATGFTLAAVVTDGAGHFLFDRLDLVPGDEVYILEAVKGLKDSAGFNAPGSAAARVRTFIRHVGGEWQGITRGRLTISTATTAIATAAGLKNLKDGPTSKPLSALLGTVEQGTADTEVVVDGATYSINARFAGTSDLSVAEYRRAFGLVAASLADDADPVASIYRDPGGTTPETQFLRTAAPTAVLGFAESKGSRGQVLTLVGRNLSADAEVWFTGFQGSVDSNLARVPVAGKVGALSADRRALQVTVPARAASGEVVYRHGHQTFRASTLFGIVGTVATVIGTGQTNFNGDGLPGERANLSSPYFLTLDSRDNLLIADLGGRVRKWDRATGAVTTVYSGGGGPVGMDFDSKGNLYVALYASNYIVKVSPQGAVTTIAGTGERAFSGDGGPATVAKVGGPHGLAIDAADNVVFCDWYNGRIRKISAATGIIETLVSTTCVGTQIGPDGALYIAAGSEIRRLDLSTKALTTWATGVQAGQDLWVDGAGNVYVATWGPGSNQVQRVDRSTRAVTIVAGNGQDGFSGDGGDPRQAAFFRTSGVAVDRAGNLFVADYSNARVRYVGLP